MKLSDKALLVQLSISQWSARKYDKRVTQEIAHNFGVSGSAVDVGRYNKNLLPIDDFLADVHQKARQIRTAFYENTLPWGLEGAQILPSKNYLGFISAFRQDKSEWEYLVDIFLQEYPRLKAEAKRIVPAGMYKEEDYPSLEDMRAKFKIDLAVFPVPSGDFRVELADDELARIQAEVENRAEMGGQRAMKEAWQRLYTRVEKMVEKLSDPKAIFRDSMVEHVREICSILPNLNFADDPNLEAMRQEVEAKLANQNADSLRLDPALRADKAAEAKDIMSKMGAFMGGI